MGEKKKSILSELIVTIIGGLVVTIIGGIALAVILNFAGINASGDPNQIVTQNHATNDPNSGSDTNIKQSKPSKFSNDSDTKTNTSKAEDYSLYINKPLNKSIISVTVIDGSGRVQTDITSEIANIYKRAGKNASTGLIKSSFTEKPEFQELREGNSTVIQKLNLTPFTDFLAIGKVQYSIRNGKLVDGAIVCNASLSMAIISTKSGSIEQSFTISNANGNGATQAQAQEDAFEKLIAKYSNEYSTF